MREAGPEITRRIVPTITVGYPNGGERLAVDSTLNIGWTASDVGGDVTVAYSIDNATNEDVKDIVVGTFGTKLTF